MPRAYAQDLAYIHDVGFGGFARDAAPGVLKILRRGGVEHGRVVDLGSGIWAQRLTRAGYDVLGIDYSAAMLALARNNAPRAAFRRQSLWSAALPACDAVTALGECLNYCFDQKQAPRLDAPRRPAAAPRLNTETQPLEQLFTRIHAALRPGGLFIFDLVEPGRAASPPQRHYEGRDWAILLTVEHDARRRELTRHITSFRRIGKTYRRSEETHRLRLYKPSDVTAALRRAGFRVRTLRGYGELRFRAGLIAFVATKK